ncbi:GNAT family N-acetyltransferase [Listeria sp. FSL L7-1509]|uniref:GNAT family N-acetyltransferase n=1 Tax=Listeria immobilis TaxID=2713502 RepID=A0ABR6SV48_9LIST|nr:GNAT family N-acetyltransferase [Listeria immobilis]MBC1483122.1 GNAT family N-acetyltransferase [Listeria immobilis]MBC1507078.1 GNAT family N-acetyltransferase [Listeria immobilis]MBC1509562.1 GNAT family N-acetyltransferase [Listeria immobilis]MBC6302375.1 GNAT family N-acetyltransferase [Listeria immobilis]
MIRKLTVSDNEEVMALLKVEATLNLFIIGDIENFGYDSDVQNLWGEFDPTGNLHAVLLRFDKFYLPYSKDANFDAKAFSEIIAKDKKYEISGISRVTQVLEPFLPKLAKRRQDTYFCECEHVNRISVNQDVIVRTAAPEDVAAIIKMRTNINEFGTREENEELIIRQIKQGVKRIYYIEQNQEIVAVAETSAENSFSAMITGVATRSKYRQKGFASTLLKKLCCDVLAEGKKPCLFYDNPVAGEIYHRLGFEHTGDFVMYK